MARKKKYEIALKLVELEAENYHIILSGRIGLVEPCHWIIDTGASKSVFDSTQIDLYQNVHNPFEEIRSAGIGEGQVETSAGMLEALSFGEFECHDFAVALINFNHINQLYSQFTDLQICGLLGSDFLLEYQAVIDYRKMKLIIQK